MTAIWVAVKKRTLRYHYRDTYQAIVFLDHGDFLSIPAVATQVSANIAGRAAEMMKEWNVLAISCVPSQNLGHGQNSSYTG